MALDENPDIVVLPGDLVGHWRTTSPWLLEAVLEPLLLMSGSVIATPGNHEYWGGDASCCGRSPRGGTAGTRVGRTPVARVARRCRRRSGRGALAEPDAVDLCQPARI
jgi:hypothetical protein